MLNLRRLLPKPCRVLLMWCGRPDLNRHGVAPDEFSYQLRFSPPPLRAFVVWTIPSPWHLRALGAARLVSTPSRRTFVLWAWLGITNASSGVRLPRV